MSAVMANHPELPKQRLAFGQLIEFIRPGLADISDNTTADSGKRQHSSLVHSSMTGDEAKSFYEELFATDVYGDEQQPFTSNKINRKRKHTSASCSTSSRHRKKISRKSALKTNNLDDVRSESQCESERRTSYDESNIFQTVGKELQFSQRTKDHRQAELFKLAQNGDNEGILSLLQYSVDVNCTDQFGWTPSMSAAFEGHVAILQTLARCGADLTIINSQGQTALSLAVNKGHKIVTKFIQSFLKGSLEISQQIDRKKESVSFYCKVCKLEFTDLEQKMHERSTVHIFNMGFKPKDDTFLIPSSNIGYRLMLKDGWSGDRGLGPYEQGNKFPVKTLLKRDRKGLGHTVADKPKVTHFAAKDKSAVERVQWNDRRREENVRTLARRAQKLKEKCNRQWEIHMRYQLS